MKEQFLPNELSHELELLGFKEKVIAIRTGNLVYLDHPSTMYLGSQTKGAGILWQQAFEWFRINYGNFYDILQFEGGLWGYSIYGQLGFEAIYKHNMFINYEEARLSCLQKLIEIIKPKNIGE
jgi:hypothetical protein